VSDYRVLINGACGRMGQEVVKAVAAEEDIRLVGAVDLINAGKDIGSIVGFGELGVLVEADLNSAITRLAPQIMIDFTNPKVIMDSLKLAIASGIHCVVGTTGLSEADLKILRQMSEASKVGVIIAPNFAIGAVLMMKFAEIASKYLPNVEIIELHHDKKMDAPSGTAIKTAELIVKGQDAFEVSHPKDEFQKISGVRGGSFGGVHIHSVRLPGLVAHQEVIFGGLGQTLSIRHDSMSRDSFMPGVIMAVREVVKMRGLVYGLENLLCL
jgi:4-hydroxy-tetrahydrodipicolinate reductase